MNMMSKHPMWSGIGFTEKDKPNFDGSFYPRRKVMMEKMILEIILMFLICVVKMPGFKRIKEKRICWKN